MSKLKLDRYKPATNKNILIVLAGFTWLGVGVMLLFLAVSWLRAVANISVLWFAGAGVVLGLVGRHFVFLKIVDKNLKRLLAMDEKKCVFAFIPWKSYLIIVLMITMGVTLRHSAIPKQYLAIPYMAVGLALLLSSLKYMRALCREIKGLPQP